MSINAIIREVQGKGASRRLRHQNKIPAVVYGSTQKPLMLTVDFFEITKLTNDARVFTKIIDLNIGKEKQAVVIKDLQRHPAKRHISHIDFLRVDEKQPITMRIPIAFTNQKKSKALRLGAILNRFLATVAVSCLPKDLPETIDVDVAALKIGDTLRLSQIKMPSGVTLLALTHGDVDTYDQTVVSVSKARKMTDVDFDDEDSAEPAAETEQSAEAEKTDAGKADSK